MFNEVDRRSPCCERRRDQYHGEVHGPSFRRADGVTEEQAGGVLFSDELPLKRLAAYRRYASSVGKWRDGGLSRALWNYARPLPHAATESGQCHLVMVLEAGAASAKQLAPNSCAIAASSIS